jgi:hypothetical protein
MATSKDTRVRVEGLSKINPKDFPASGESTKLFFHLLFNTRLLFNKASISLRERSAKLKKSRFFIFASTPGGKDFIQSLHEKVDFFRGDDQGGNKSHNRVTGTIDQKSFF